MIDRFKIWLVVRVLWLYTYFVGLTSRVRWIGREFEQDLIRRKIPAIYAFWHGRQAMLLYYHKGKDISILISPSKDGEIVARIAACYGIPSVRGSSRKKPAEGLIRLVRVIKRGGHIAITPDGPLGPAQSVKQGVLYLAQALGVPILPLTSSYARKVVFKSWDRFNFPFPFNRAVVAYGSPIYVKKEEDFGRKTEELKQVLDNLTRQADDLVSAL
ncbi:MAG: lysophospholipid acyltransferase family protein [Elusimicrobia bacterium]|nr:lysophospholipid acyltransferase family protein [Elusimicrobiota bacterium]